MFPAVRIKIVESLLDNTKDFKNVNTNIKFEINRVRSIEYTHTKATQCTHAAHNERFKSKTLAPKGAANWCTWDFDFSARTVPGGRWFGGRRGGPLFNYY